MTSILALMPLYIWTVLLVLLPMGYVFLISFATRNEIYGVDYVFNFESYKKLLAPVNLQILWASLKMAVWTTLSTLVIGYPFAQAMAARRSARQRNLILLMVIVPFWTSALLRVYGWMTFLRSNGTLNTVLLNMGLIDTPIRFLYHQGSVLFGMVYSLLPFMILPLYTSIEKQDHSIIEAARDLGANPVKAFFTITLPMTMPGVVSGSMLVFVPSVGLFFISDLMGGGKEMVLGNLINHYLHAGKDWPLGAALSMVMMVLSLLTMSVYRKYAGNDSLGVF